MNKSEVKARLKAQRIETPSWGYADSGTRFKVFEQPAAAVTLQEKLEDAAQVHKLTGVAPVGGHPHPLGQDRRLARHPEVRRRPRPDHRAPSTRTCSRKTSTCSAASAIPWPRCGRQAIDHMLECVEIAKETGCDILSLWLADGTNYPGQDNIRERKERLQEAPAEIYEPICRPRSRMLIEYKFFEPAFYRTDLPDWGTAYVLRPQARPAGAGAGRPRPPRAGHRTSSRSSPSCSTKAGSAASTSTTASTPTTT